MRYPELVLLVAVGGVVLWLVTPELGAQAFYPTRCRGRTEAVSLAVVASGNLPYTAVWLRCRIR